MGIGRKYYLDIRIKYAYIKFKRKLSLYFTLWFLALLAGASLVFEGIFIQYNVTLKLWSTIVVILLFIKLGYDAVSNMRKQYDDFKRETNQTDAQLRKY